MTPARTARNVAFVLLGVAVLVLKPGYHGPLAQAVNNWGGNFSISFAVYFLAAIGVSRYGAGRVAASALALLIVEGFELTNGFGVMSNVYDPVDLVANAVGVGIALALDLTSRGPATTQAPD